MKKMEFQKYAFSEVSRFFLKQFMQGDVRKYSSEAKGDRQKIKYEPAGFGNLAIYFFKTGTIQIYQRGDFQQQQENAYYEWLPTSDYKDVVAAFIKDLAVFINKLNGSDNDCFADYWGHDGFYDFAYETSKHRTAFPESGE
jgi:hypothetical protein